MNIKNVVVVIFAVSLLSAIGFSVMKKQKSEQVISAEQIEQKGKLVIKGIVTSEKESFFKDERVIKIFNDNDIDLHIQRWSSGKIAQATKTEDFGEYSDFVFPPGVQTSDKVKNTIKGAQAYNIFYSPMIVATWKPIVDILNSNNLIENKKGYQSLKMQEFLNVVDNKTKWKDLKNSSEYDVNKNVLIYTSDARYSNASKMYMGLTSYVYNNSEIISSQENINNVLPKIKNMMAAQGNRESSSTNLFTDYTAIGMGKAPMIFVYESEFLEFAFRNNKLPDNMTFLYPSPTLFTKHVMVGFNPKAQKLVDLLNNNEELKLIAADYGFRFTGNNKLVEKANKLNIKIPETVVDVIDPPSFDVLEQLVNSVESK